MTAIRPIADYIAALAMIRTEIKLEITKVQTSLRASKEGFAETFTDKRERAIATAYETGLKYSLALLERHLRRLGID